MSHTKLPYPWVHDDILALDRTKEIGHVLPTVLNVIQRFGSPVLMVSGPISTGGAGTLQKNLERFGATIDGLVEQGHKVFSQMPAESAIIRLKREWEAKNNHGYCMPILEHFYGPIFRSGLIEDLVFLPDWRSSKGARWEHRLAVSLNLKRTFLKVGRGDQLEFPFRITAQRLAVSA